MSVQERMRQAFDYFVSRGWTREQSAGIVGNLHYESGGLNIDARGDFMGGRYTAFGLAQWRGERLRQFERLFGTSIGNSTFEQQLQFVDWELRNTERGAGRALGLATTVEGATETFMTLFERPSRSAARTSLDDRTRAAQQAAGNSAASGGFNPLDPLGDYGIGIGDIVGNPVTGEGPDFSFNPFGIFDSALVGRIIAVVVGVILIGLAIAAFVLLGDGKKTIVETVAKAAT